jgi:hypothetical protein
MPSTAGPKTALQGTTYLAGAAIVKYRAVKRGADKNTAILATLASPTLGIAMDNQDNVGKAFPVAHREGEMVLAAAGAAFALDAELTPDANGRLIAAATTQKVCAIAREAATALDQLVAVEWLGAAGRIFP